MKRSIRGIANLISPGISRHIIPGLGLEKIPQIPGIPGITTLVHTLGWSPTFPVHVTRPGSENLCVALYINFGGIRNM